MRPYRVEMQLEADASRFANESCQGHNEMVGLDKL